MTLQPRKETTDRWLPRLITRKPQVHRARVVTWLIRLAGLRIDVRVFEKEDDSRTAVTGRFQLHATAQSRTWADIRTMVFDHLRKHTKVRVDEKCKLKLYSVNKEDLNASDLEVSALKFKLIGTSKAVSDVKHVAALLSKGRAGLRTLPMNCE